MENVGATLLFHTAPIERLRASPMCHRREASKQINYLCPCRNTEGNTPSISEILRCSLPAASGDRLGLPGPPVCKWAPGQVRSACTPRLQPCVRAQATLYKKKRYLPVMKATNSDSKRCEVSVDVSFRSPSCFQRKKAHTFSSQAKGGRPHRLLLGGVQSKQRRNHLCGGNVLM